MDEERTCACGMAFTIEVGEKRWFEGKGFELPRRCKPCREKRKREKATENQSDRDLLA